MVIPLLLKRRGTLKACDHDVGLFCMINRGEEMSWSFPGREGMRGDPTRCTHVGDARATATAVLRLFTSRNVYRVVTVRHATVLMFSTCLV